ncbi:hypothetical protein VTK73DRAFT_8697 [Phialemonium thermophilum]|uniref:Uncharacterized protein n=1 Tax=Phialemonium thermophilum TaxID=223376 RepID=A0ABR3W6W8_9PEZI
MKLTALTLFLVAAGCAVAAPVDQHAAYKANSTSAAPLAAHSRRYETRDTAHLPRVPVPIWTREFRNNTARSVEAVIAVNASRPAVAIAPRHFNSSTIVARHVNSSITAREFNSTSAPISISEIDRREKTAKREGEFPKVFDY